LGHPPQNPSSPIAPGDARLDSAAFHRNHEPIWAVLSRWIEDRPGNVLEVGSGSGQHIIEFARKDNGRFHLRTTAGTTFDTGAVVIASMSPPGWTPGPPTSARPWAAR